MFKKIMRGAALTAIALMLCFPADARPQGFRGGPVTADRIKRSLVSGLPTSGATARVFVVTDGNASDDCSTGGGSDVVYCWNNGTSWAAVGGGGGDFTADGLVPMTGDLDMATHGITADGDLKLVPDATGDVTFFEDTDVGDAVDGKALYIHRKAVEGDNYFRMFIDQYNQPKFYAPTGFYIDSGSGDVRIQSTVHGGVTFFDSSAGNETIRQGGTITAAGGVKDIQWQVNDTTDNFELTREDSNIGAFDIQMPLITDAIATSEDITVNGMLLGLGGGDISTNLALGTNALTSNTTGTFNVAIGTDALTSNETGGSNVAIGRSALVLDEGTGSNIAIGRNALYGQITGNENLAIGLSAGTNISSGWGNIFIGNSSGIFHADGSTLLTSPSKSIYIGRGTRGFSNSDTNSIVIGNGAVGIGANTVVLGDDNIVTTLLKGNVGIGADTTPDYLLDVQGTFNADGNSLIGGTLGVTGDATFSSNLLLPGGLSTVSADCDEEAEEGRVFVDNDATSGERLYVCEGTAGWILYASGAATLFNNIGDADGDGSIALTGYKQILTSTLNTAGGILSLTNTTADLTSDVSFMDFKYTDDGDVNGFYLRGYDNAAADLRWSIANDGAFTGKSFTAEASATPAYTQIDSDGVGDINGQIDGNLTDTGDGSEDYDIHIKQQIAGTLTTVATFDADGDTDFPHYPRVAFIVIQDDTTANAVADGVGDFEWVPGDTFSGYNIVDVEAGVYVAGTTGTLDVQIHNVTSAADVLSTKLTIDTGETSTHTAAAAAVISGTEDDITAGDRFRFDIDAIHTTPAQGFWLELKLRKP